MKQKWEELLVVLNAILGIYESLLILSKTKKDILVAAKSHDLEKVVKQEEILVLQIGKLEERRQRLVCEILKEHGITDQETSFAQIQKIVIPDVAKELDSFGQKIGIIMEELGALNKLNTELITQALGFINFNINILSQTVVGPTYAPKGQANEQTKRTVFDAKV